jgi:hypothetical protein
MTCTPAIKVAAIRGDDLDAMNRDAIDALGGMQPVVAPGGRFLLSPTLLLYPGRRIPIVFTMVSAQKLKLSLLSPKSV